MQIPASHSQPVLRSRLVAFPLALTLVLINGFISQITPSLAGKAERVVIVVFDGMRPDFVTPQFAPNLYSLATNGVFFRKNHCTYISTTIVNGTTIATGTYPGRSGIIANSDFRPELNSQTAIASEILDTVRRGDMLHQDKYVAVDTLAELIQDAGHHTFIAGTKAVALIHDRGERKTDTEAHKNSITLFRGLTLPRRELDPLQKVNDDKVFPDTFTNPNLASDAWTTKALINGLWKKGVPKYSLLWLSDPDITQHAKAVGAPESVTAIENSDKHLGQVIDKLREKKLLDSTDIIVVSDHAFSSISRGADIAAALRKVKINAHTKLDNPEPGDGLVIPLGGSALFYVINRQEDVIQKTVDFLQSSDFAGVIFSRLDIKGTFPLSAIHYDNGKGAPDLVLSSRWTHQSNEFGSPGMLYATGGTKGTGTHGSLSPYEMNNTLVASGPDFKKGLMSEIPSGNIDLAPTVLHLLGIKPKSKMDGRILHEGLVDNNEPRPTVTHKKLEASRDVGFMRWEQYLNVIEVNGVSYFSEGNGSASHTRQ